MDSHSFAAHCAQRLRRARDPGVRKRIERELQDWLRLAEQRSFPREAPEPSAPPASRIYEIRLLVTGAQGWAVEPLTAASDHAAIDEAIRRSKGALIVEVWRDDRFICRCEVGQPPAASALGANRRRGALSGWVRRKGELSSGPVE
jgi:hypothetical protein